MDKMMLSRMEFYGYHGVFPEENKLGQRFYADVELYYSMAKAGRNDDLQATVNYAEVYECVRKIVEEKTFKLIEALAENVASAVLEAFSLVEEITVRIIKPHPPFDIHFEGATVEIHRKRTATAYIGLGSNLGDRAQFLQDAIDLLDRDPSVEVTGHSSIYETEPVGFVEQDRFLNQVIRVRTELGAEELLAVLMDVEQVLGRQRDLRWGPRTIDLDLLLYGDRVLHTKALTIPHPRMAERAFVLVPLEELAGDVTLPGIPSLSLHVQALEGKEGVTRWINTD